VQDVLKLLRAHSMEANRPYQASSNLPDGRAATAALEWQVGGEQRLFCGQLRSTSSAPVTHWWSY